MTKTFFIADLHLGHTNIIKYCDRPFKTVEQMNVELILRWNQTVNKSDIVFFLGDFGFGNAEQIIEWGRQLNGNKSIILGNHDTKSPDVYHEAGFRFISKYPILWNGYFILSHKPVFITESSPYFNIYGHVHNNPSYVDFSHNSFCVSAERVDYKPITYEEIQRSINEPSGITEED